MLPQKSVFFKFSLNRRIFYILHFICYQLLFIYFFAHIFAFFFINNGFLTKLHYLIKLLSKQILYILRKCFSFHRHFYLRTSVKSEFFYKISLFLKISEYSTFSRNCFCIANFYWFFTSFYGNEFFTKRNFPYGTQNFFTYCFSFFFKPLFLSFVVIPKRPPVSKIL